MISNLTKCSFAIIVLVLAFATIAPVSANSKNPSHDTIVVIAEDKTREAQCIMSVDSPENTQDCAPGSMIFTREISLKEAKKLGITTYVILTGNQKKDRAQIDALVANLHNSIASTPITPAACFAVFGKVIGGSYLSVPSNPASARIFYEIRYDVRNTCEVVNIQDRTRSSGPSFLWLSTCTNDTLGCTQHNLSFGGAFTAWRFELNSRVGARYVHTSFISSLAARPFGWTNFVN